MNGKKVAFTTARTTYFHEPDSIVGFMRFNRPGSVKNAKTFQKAASKIQFTFNWAYSDAKKTSFYLSGAYPQRAPWGQSACPAPPFPRL